MRGIRLVCAAALPKPQLAWSETIQGRFPGPHQAGHLRLGAGQVRLGLCDVEARRQPGFEAVARQRKALALRLDVGEGVVEAQLQRPGVDVAEGDVGEQRDEKITIVLDAALSEALPTYEERIVGFWYRSFIPFGSLASAQR